MSRRIPLIAGGVVVLLLLGWYVALWRPAVAESARANASEAAARVQLTTLDAQLAGLKALQRTLPSEQAKLRQAAIEVPADSSIPTLIDQINAIAVADHITWSNESTSLGTAVATTALASAPATALSGDSSLALTLDVTGPFASMATFLTDLTNRPRLIVVNSISYSPGDGGAVTVTMSAEAFYNSAASPAAPAAAGS